MERVRVCRGGRRPGRGHVAWGHVGAVRVGSDCTLYRLQILQDGAAVGHSAVCSCSGCQQGGALRASQPAELSRASMPDAVPAAGLSGESFWRNDHGAGSGRF